MAIPVYLFAGFLESGKTSFIASVLQDPGFTRDEHTLIVQCEEGMEEFEPAMLKKTHSVVECVEDEEEYNADTLRAFGEQELAGMLARLEEERFGLVLRAKGIVPCRDGGWLHFDYTPGEQDVRRGPADFTGRLCVIGSKLSETELSKLFDVA